MSDKEAAKSKEYYFIDVDLTSRQVIGWGTEQKDEVEVHLTKGYHSAASGRNQR